MSPNVAQKQLQLLTKEINTIYAEVLETLLKKYPKVELRVEGNQEYNDNDYSNHIYFYVDDFRLDEYTLEDEYSEDKERISEFKQKGIDLEEILEHLYIIPQSFWNDYYGSSFEVKINLTFIKKLKKGFHG